MEVVMNLSLAAAGVAATVYFGLAQVRQFRERQSINDFLAVRAFMKDEPPGFQARAESEQGQLLAEDPLPPVIVQPGWLFDRPLAMNSIVSAIEDDTSHDPDAQKHKNSWTALKRYWPIDASGQRMERYHLAVAAYDPPGNWFDSASYRLKGVNIDEADGVRLSLSETRYWDGFDTSEALVHEGAAEYIRTRGRTIVGPFRRALKSPFNLADRHCTIGMIVLTIRRADNEPPTFYLHRRSTSVATGSNITSVIPAGEFQPSSDSRFAFARDANLWFGVMREYAEEMLGMEEVRSDRGAPIDYLAESPFVELERGRERGEIRPYVLGIGMDPVSWKAQVYAVCIFEAETFDTLFAEMPRRNLEGMIQVPSFHRKNPGPYTGWKLDEETVRLFATDPRVGPSSKATLLLTMRNRSYLGL